MTSSEFFRDAPLISVTNPVQLNTCFGGVNPLDPSHPAFEFYVICIYAVSGQYGFIARQLYYCTLVFSVMVCDGLRWKQRGAWSWIEWLTIPPGSIAEMACCWRFSFGFNILVRQRYPIILIWHSNSTDSGTAAIHAFILVIIYRFKHMGQMIEDPYLLGDVDIEPIFSILCWMASVYNIAKRLFDTSPSQRTKNRLMLDRLNRRWSW